jgi:hypothetical protein
MDNNSTYLRNCKLRHHMNNHWPHHGLVIETNGTYKKQNWGKAEQMEHTWEDREEQSRNCHKTN